MEWNDSEVNRAFSAWLSVGNRIPGALPQARVELRAFGAKHVQENLCLLVANTHVLTFPARA